MQKSQVSGKVRSHKNRYRMPKNNTQVIKMRRDTDVQAGQRSQLVEQAEGDAVQLIGTQIPTQVGLKMNES